MHETVQEDHPADAAHAGGDDRADVDAGGLELALVDAGSRKNGDAA
jgi:hypothetical protein